MAKKARTLGITIATIALLGTLTFAISNAIARTDGANDGNKVALCEAARTEDCSAHANPAPRAKAEDCDKHNNPGRADKAEDCDIRSKEDCDLKAKEDCDAKAAKECDAH